MLGRNAAIGRLLLSEPWRMSAKWVHKGDFYYLVGTGRSIRVHWASERKEWCVLVSIAYRDHHEYYMRWLSREKVLRHARVLFNAIEGKA